VISKIRAPHPNSRGIHNADFLANSPGRLEERDAMVRRIRHLAAGPFYLVAFCCHLLCALFSVIAEKIAGEGKGLPARAASDIQNR
jgi:hypothetical protein